MPRTRRRISVTPKNKPLRKSSGRSSDKSTRLGRVLVESAKQIAQHMRGEIELPMKVVRLVPDVDSVYFIAVYAKNEKENLSDAEKQALAKILRPIKRQEH